MEHYQQISKILTFGLILLTCAHGLADTITNFSCYGDTCQMNVSFCETEKQVCRRCQDFRESCWTNQIPNCTVFCLDNVPPPGYVKNNTSIQSNQDSDQCNQPIDNTFKIATIVLSVLLAASMCVIIFMYWKLKQRSNLQTQQSTSTISTTSLEDSNEEGTVLLSSDKNQNDLPEIVVPTSIPRGVNTKLSIDLSQITSTNDRKDNPRIVISGKTSEPFMTKDNTVGKVL